METKTSLKVLSQLLTDIRPYLAMICLQFGYAGMYIVTMVSFKQGMSHWVLVVYRHVVATLAIAPFAFILERKIRPKLTLSVFLKVMLLGLLEPVIDQNLYYVGMKSTSATFAAATVNVLPALTFIMAIIFRMERVNLRQKHGLAKVIGTSITLSGAMLMTLYKGPVVNILGGYSHGSEHETSGDTSSGQHWASGTIMLLSCTVGWSAFFIVQSMTLKEYPAALSLTSLICVMGMLEGGVVALVMERDMSAWAIGFDSRLLAAAYSGVVCSGIAYYVQGFVNKVRGPVFVTAFSPLAMIITAILGAFILSEQVRLGSLLGAVVVVIGLYSVVWGKSKDEKITSGECKVQELPVVLEIKNKLAHDNFDEAPASNHSIAVKNSLSGEP
ncbi:hypothetical protein POM88_015079 [Heracleum sosnowskyi]|uniref:WAT1-related protein n=1 Tax=Heracleum sosnowskyi TaxID=360622 RepID=A0AAD8MVI5_9APIA|nr:hypothetical protein POM88_015074 [Heracleum sosnowskyi]KAK1386901.1 hypothetical protein POM88_015079 [Heracleum sosnowskyi]